MFYIMQTVDAVPHDRSVNTPSILAASRGIVNGEWETKAEAAAAAMTLAQSNPGTFTVVKAVALVRVQPSVEDVV